jgi:hemerythrin superfamily protein
MGQDMVNVLVKDHEEVKELFREIESATDGKTRRAKADQVTAELVRHSVAEEMYLYPAARKVLSNGDQLADHEIEEHAEAEQLLKRWEKMDGDDPEFMSVFREMSQAVLHHIEEEEGTLFPELQTKLDANEMVQLGEKIDKAKKMAPTRPHPSAPDEPPMNKILGAPTGVVDRVRDLMSGRKTG